MRSIILAALAAFIFPSCIIGRKDSDHLRLIPFNEWKDMDVTPWHPHPETMNEAIDRAKHGTNR